MANQKISAMTAASTLDGSELIAGVQAGGNVKILASDVLTYIATLGSAATLTTPRTINGTSFNGSANITVTAAAGTLTGTTLNSTVVTSSLTSVGTLTGITTSGTLTLSGGSAATVDFSAGATFTASGGGAGITFDLNATPGAGVYVSFGATTGFRLPVVTTAQRDLLNNSTPLAGFGVYNSTATRNQFYDGSAWHDFVRRDGDTMTGALVLSPSPASGAALTITSTNALAVAIGPNGTTNASLVIDNSTASAANGLKLTPSASASNVTLTVQSSGGTDGLVIVTKGIGSRFQVNNGTNSFIDARATFTAFAVGGGAQSSGAVDMYSFTGAAHTGQTASTEVRGLVLNFAQTLQHAAGALTLQRSVSIAPHTLGFVSASTVTDAATLGLTGAPVAGTNATLTNSSAIYVGAGAVASGTTNSFGLKILNQTGATNNFAALLGTAGTAFTNIRHGISGAMVLGAVTVTDTACTANTRYFFSAHTLGTISIPGGYYASTRNAGTSFVITSSQATETSTIDWVAVEP